MNAQHIKPIPKYMLNLITKTDKKVWPEQIGHVRFYAYLTKVKGELVKVTVAVKNYKKKDKGGYYKQVAIHGVKSDNCLVRDMEYHYHGFGYRVGWYAEGIQKHKKWFEDGIWHTAKFKYYNPYAAVINPEYIDRFHEYKYSAYQHFNGNCIIRYLRLYRTYPQTEYLLKHGLDKLHNSVTILRLVAKDKGGKAFCKWLISNKGGFTSSNYYISSIIRAYRTGKPLKQIQALAEFKKKLEFEDRFKPLRDMFRKDLQQFITYLELQKTSPSCYLDYLNACNYLVLDMSLGKNRFPHDFKRWHDIRIDEFHTAKALADEKERAELYRQFSAVAQKYTALQKIKGDYAVIIASSPDELKHEGDMLKHCVGKTDYEQRIIRQDSLIFFVRDARAPDIPFVTVEYSLKSKSILQCYGDKNTKPDGTVLDFVHKIWLKHANKTIKKIKEAEAA